MFMRDLRWEILPYSVSSPEDFTSFTHRLVRKPDIASKFALHARFANLFFNRLSCTLDTTLSSNRK
jgi:hypothetical protein